MGKWFVISVFLCCSMAVQALDSGYIKRLKSADSASLSDEELEAIDRYDTFQRRIRELKLPGYRNLVTKVTLDRDSYSFKLAHTFKHEFIGVNKYSRGNMYHVKFAFDHSVEITTIFNQYAELDAVLRIAEKSYLNRILINLHREYHFISDQYVENGLRFITFEAVDTTIYVRVPKEGSTLSVEYIDNDFQQQVETMASDEKHLAVSAIKPLYYTDALPLKQRHCLIDWSSDRVLSIFSDSGISLAHRPPGICVEPQWLNVKRDFWGYQPHIERIDLLSNREVVLYRYPALQKLMIETPVDPRLIPIPAMVPIRGESRDTGCLISERECEEHAKPVKEYYVSETEVTIEQYFYYCAREPSCWPRWHRDDRNMPVRITLAQAKRYVAWLRDMTGKPYRLPTEAEWEYAARAGAKSQYSWGDTASGLHANGQQGHHSHLVRDLQQEMGEKLWPEDGYASAAPVKSFLPNAWGLYDMLGNAAEWCVNGVQRGGSWNAYAEALRIDYREENVEASSVGGVRLVMDQ